MVEQFVLKVYCRMPHGFFGFCFLPERYMHTYVPYPRRWRTQLIKLPDSEFGEGLLGRIVHGHRGRRNGFWYTGWLCIDLVHGYSRLGLLGAGMIMWLMVWKEVEHEEEAVAQRCCNIWCTSAYGLRPRWNIEKELKWTYSAEVDGFCCFDSTLNRWAWRSGEHLVAV